MAFPFGIDPASQPFFFVCSFFLVSSSWDSGGGVFLGDVSSSFWVCQPFVFSSSIFFYIIIFFLF